LVRFPSSHKKIEMAVPQGYRLGGVYCGIKRYDDKLDLSLLVSDRPAVAAGVYTTNLVFAAPVKWDRSLTPGVGLRGDQFRQRQRLHWGPATRLSTDGRTGGGDLRRCVRATVLSTASPANFADGVNRKGIRDVAGKLGTDEASRPPRGMLTTDTRHKVATRTIHAGPA
jgi:hypothetical protein